MDARLSQVAGFGGSEGRCNPPLYALFGHRPFPCRSAYCDADRKIAQVIGSLTDDPNIPK
jgi:hypothetical protein